MSLIKFPSNLEQLTTTFSVPSQFHPRHFQVKLITFFFSSQESAFFAPILTFFSHRSHTQQQLCQQHLTNFPIQFQSLRRKEKAVSCIINSTWVNSLPVLLVERCTTIIYMYVFCTLLYLGTFNVLKYCFYSNFDNLARTLLNNAVLNSIDVSLWSVLKINKLTFSQFYLHLNSTGKIAASHFNFGYKLDILKIWLKLCISQF